MAKLYYVQANKKAIAWALKHGENTNSIIQRYDVNKWIHPKKESDYPTFKQLQELSYYTRVPFNYFFGKSIPHKPNSFAQFRTINNKQNDTLSWKLIDVIDNMKSRQEWMKNHLLHQNNQYAFKCTKYINYDMDTKLASNKVNKLLNLNSIRENSTSGENGDRTFFNLLRQKISTLGIIVMQSGIVGNNTHRKLNVKEFRAFTLVDNVVPLIFINNSDSMRAKVFSLIHEFVHILLGQTEILNASLETSNHIESERWINKVTANVLVPRSLVLNYINGVPMDEVRNIAAASHTSKLAVAIRLKHLNVYGVTESLINHIKQLQNRNIIMAKNNKPSGGNYYNNVSSRLDTHFAAAVVNSESEGTISLPRAASMLDISVKSYSNAVKRF